jgi:hypothetical protein
LTKEKLIKAFNAEFTETDANGNRIVKGSPDNIIKWISDKLSPTDSPPFSKAFTGMLDKNGMPIHEGNKVKFYHKGEYAICEVIYDQKHAAFLIKWPDGYINQYFMNGSSFEVVGW